MEWLIIIGLFILYQIFFGDNEDDGSQDTGESSSSEYPKLPKKQSRPIRKTNRSVAANTPMTMSECRQYLKDDRPRKRILAMEKLDYCVKSKVIPSAKKFSLVSPLLEDPNAEVRVKAMGVLKIDPYKMILEILQGNDVKAKVMAVQMLYPLFKQNKLLKSDVVNLLQPVYDDEVGKVQESITTLSRTANLYFDKHTAIWFNHSKSYCIPSSTARRIKIVEIPQELDMQTAAAVKLYKAIVKNDADEVITQLKRDANINSITLDRTTPLILSIRMGQRRNIITELLIDNGAKVNARTVDQFTPLMYAAANGNNEIVELLIKKGANPNAVSVKSLNKKAIDFARKGGYDKTALIIGRATHNVKPVSRNRNSSKSSVLVTDPYNPRNASDKLYAAALNRDIDAIKTALNHGANIDVHDMTGMTPLMIALYQGSEDIARFLINNGANVNAKTIDPFTPIIYAAAQGYTDVVRLLLEKGADTNVRSGPPKNFTASQFAELYNHVEVVKAIESAKGKGFGKLRNEKLDQFIEFGSDACITLNTMTQTAIDEKRSGNYDRALAIYERSLSIYPGIDLKRSISKAKVLLLLGRKNEAIDDLINGISYFVKFESDILSTGGVKDANLALSAIEYYAYCLKNWPDNEDILDRLKGFKTQTSISSSTVARMKLGMDKLKKMGIWCETFKRVKLDMIDKKPFNN